MALIVRPYKNDFHGPYCIETLRFHQPQKPADNGTRELSESILTDEEKHIDWLEAQLDQIRQMGIQNYPVEQVG